MKTLTNTVLPRVALYKALQEKGFTQEQAYECLRKYMIGVVGAKNMGQPQEWKSYRDFISCTVISFLKLCKLPTYSKADRQRAKIILM